MGIQTETDSNCWSKETFEKNIKARDSALNGLIKVESAQNAVHPTLARLQYENLLIMQELMVGKIKGLSVSSSPVESQARLHLVEIKNQQESEWTAHLLNLNSSQPSGQADIDACSLETIIEERNRVFEKLKVTEAALLKDSVLDNSSCQFYTDASSFMLWLSSMANRRIIEEQKSA